MATYDMTSSATVGVDSNSIAAATSRYQAMGMYMREARLDIAKMVEDGYSCANGDIFQLLEIPANTMVLFAGAEVETAFNGSSPTVDIDFAAGDDIVDGGDVTSTGFLAGGTNGQTMVVNTAAADTFTAHVTTTDTIDVKLIASSADVTSGILRVIACCIDTGARGGRAPTEVDRDLLA
tara:strand:+ start:67 stop:603 length:537 start_codon:yes stop_codon:yes gene_type:complete